MLTSLFYADLLNNSTQECISPDYCIKRFDLGLKEKTSSTKIVKSEDGVFIMCIALDLEKEDISIKVKKGNQLFVNSKKEEKQKLKETNSYFKSNIDFAYKLSLDLDAKKLNASLQKGVLKIFIPYTDQVKESLEFKVK